MNAVVLGGGSPDDSLARRYGVPAKPLVPVAGRPMAAYVLDALRASGVVDRVVYVGPAAGLEPAPEVVLAQRGGMLENLEAGLSVAGEEKALVVSADDPFLTPEAVRWVVAHAPEAALVYPVVPREAVEARWPGMRRTYARLREGQFTGGNLVLLDPALFRGALDMARRVIALRKRPLALARLVGLDILWKLLWGRLAIAEVEARASRILGVPLRALVTPYAEVGVDVDKETDLVWLEGVVDANRA
ncbi:molybdenum cofactor guanylyltransferase [Marinithermus hydrothermalis]|uniref:Acylneuraminate cytidylyltransferase n=1 Tax=Marinithermus hydrothermalis (strain DSM 14884 / JCM 11576 / T1) TaxID=869210 RepID=F2NQ26_MARHT|nr:NTP transferase domain-containing protein [Marinithermus hydrothermalis]AEB11127.1 acylneuraminate cytidylyltransferase [Marinithermus hydrothermalis DSM 14884]